MKRKEKQEKTRKEVEERMKARGKRTDRQQLAKLDAGGFTAKKERSRLEKRIAKEEKIQI